MTETQDQVFLEVARRIGRRLVEQAVWSESCCTWYINTLDRTIRSPRRSIQVIAPGSVYQGAAGIALFLGELHGQTNDEVYRSTAQGALRYAVREGEKLSASNFGFHGGRTGIAYCLARLGILWEEEWLIEEAGRILRPLIGNETNDVGIDVIGGSAGAIPALLQLSQMLNDGALIEVAVRLGEHLLQIARREPIGWSWNSSRSTSVRNLTGYAHGAAGFAHALLELHNATGVGKYLYGCEQAFLYERQFFNPEVSNWPDFRHMELYEYVEQRRFDELKIALRKGLLTPYRLNYMVAWCHGAPGIGLSRCRAYSLLGEPRYKRELEQALLATEGALNSSNQNYSLCHGLAGNCELLLEASETLGDESHRRLAQRCGYDGWERIEQQGKRWICGTLGGVSDPSLMMGEAGIGYFYLRLFSGEIPSILLLRGGKKAGSENVERESYTEAQRAYVDSYFGNAVKKLKLDVGLICVAGDGSSEGTWSAESDVSRVCRYITREMASRTETERTVLDTTMAMELARYELALSISDFTEEFLRGVSMTPAEEINWDDVKIKLGSHCRIVHARTERIDKLRIDPTVEDDHSEGEHWLLHRDGNQIRVRKMDLFASLVLDALQNCERLEDIVNVLQGQLSGGHNADESLLRKKVLGQLQEAFRSRIIVCEGLATRQVA